VRSFHDRVRVPEIALVTLTERPGINRWHLLRVMTERDRATQCVAVPASISIRLSRPDFGDPALELL
jgi:hypothetical protein